jgi:probable HAF family extracellular repeat protein
MYAVEDYTGWDLWWPDLCGINAANQAVGELVQGEIDDPVVSALLVLEPGDVQIVQGPGGTSYTRLLAINDQGVAVGLWRESSYPWAPHAFMYADGELVELDPILGSSVSIARDINNQGVVVGSADFSADGDEGQSHAFFYDPSAAAAATDLGLLPGTSSGGANAVNESNQVVGAMLKDAAHAQPFLSGDGALSTLAEGGVAYDINDQGHIVGTLSGPSLGSTPFLWIDGEITHIPCDGYPSAINNHDQIVGTAAFTQPNTVGFYRFFYDASAGSSLPSDPESTTGEPSPGLPPQVSGLANLVQLDPGVELASAHDINDDGRISGGLFNADSFGDGVVLIPPDKPWPQLGERIALLVAIMLFGKGQDGGGLSLVGGKPVPIDPLGPLTEAQKERLLEQARTAVDQIVTQPAERRKVMAEVTAIIERSGTKS